MDVRFWNAQKSGEYGNKQFIIFYTGSMKLTNVKKEDKENIFSST